MVPQTPTVPAATTWHDLTPGTLLFCARGSILQRAGERFGDPWHHVAIVVRLDGELGAVGFGLQPRPSFMPITEVATRYRAAGSPDFLEEPMAAALADWAVGQLGNGRRYPVTAIATAGLLSMARTAANGPLSGIARGAAVCLAVLHGAALVVRHRRHPVSTCSTFVLAGIDHVTASSGAEGMLAVDLLAPKDWTPDRVGPIGRWLARWFATPSDLWRSVPPDRRRLIVPSGQRAGVVDTPHLSGSGSTTAAA